MQQPSRIAVARRRLRVARYAIGVTAAVSFAGFAAVARATHPGTHQSTATAASVSNASQSASSDFFGNQTNSYSGIGPSGSATPQIQSSGS
jgi:hypothetical protein